MNEFFGSIGEALLLDFQDIRDIERLTHVALRLIFAALLGGLLGYERERSGKAAGLRTHMLVSVGAAFFILVPHLEGVADTDMARVVQGIVTGVGFLGAGTILKLASEHQVKGLTTAAGIWLTAAVGVAVGFGRLGTATLAAILAFAILGLLQRFERVVAPDVDQEGGVK